jgi:large subunit ribosomal protein L21
MAYAIVETSGTQIRVEPGRFYDVNRLHAEEDEKITLDNVLFVENDGEFTVGQPLVEGATVEATVQRHLRGRKIIVYKMQPKKKTRKKRGHRQELTRVMITGININGTLLTESTAEFSPAKPVEEAAVDAAAEVTEAPAVETEATAGA